MVIPTLVGLGNGFDTSKANRPLLIGGGMTDANRKDIFTVDWDGNINTNGEKILNQSEIENKIKIKIDTIKEKTKNLNTTELIRKYIRSDGELINNPAATFNNFLSMTYYIPVTENKTYTVTAFDAIDKSDSYQNKSFNIYFAYRNAAGNVLLDSTGAMKHIVYSNIAATNVDLDDLHSSSTAPTGAIEMICGLSASTTVDHPTGILDSAKLMITEGEDKIILLEFLIQQNL